MHIHTCFKGTFMSASEHMSPLLQTCSSDLFKPSPLVFFPLCAFPGCVTYSAPCLGLLVDSMGRNSTHTQCTLPSTGTDPPALLLMPDGSATACVPSQDALSCSVAMVVAAQLPPQPSRVHTTPVPTLLYSFPPAKCPPSGGSKDEDQVRF